MTYEKLIEKLLSGKTLNAASKELGVPQATLYSWSKANSFPSCGTTKRLAVLRGIDPTEALNAVADKETEVKPRRAYLPMMMEKVSVNFEALLSHVRLYGVRLSMQ